MIFNDHVSSYRDGQAFTQMDNTSNNVHFFPLHVQNLYQDYTLFGTCFSKNCIQLCLLGKTIQKTLLNITIISSVIM